MGKFKSWQERINKIKRIKILKVNNFDQSFKGRPLIIFFIVVFGIAIYQLVINKGINDRGIYTKCTVVNSEGYKGGIIITIEYSYKGKKYTGRLNSSLGRAAIGNQYFIKLLPKSPEAVIFLKEYSVPDCLLIVDSPFDGWKELPKCQ